jgi:hypothetical protein
MKAKPVAKPPTDPLLLAEDAELLATLKKAEEERARVERALSEVAEEIADALGAETPDAERRQALNAKRSRLEREREKALARVKEVEKLIASAAARKAAREALATRVEQHQALQSEAETARKILTHLVEVARKAVTEFPWEHSGLHANGNRMRMLLEEIKFDAEEAGIEAPQLPELGDVVASLGGELLGIARDLGRRANTEPPMREYYTARGKARRREAMARQEEARQQYGETRAI